MSSELSPEIPARLATALRRAHLAERAASGAQRRAAFGLTRVLLGGARAAGFGPKLLAECMGLSISSINSRAHRDGWVTPELFAELAGLDVDAMSDWDMAGLIPSRARDDDGRQCHLASELIRALVGAGSGRSQISTARQMSGDDEVVQVAARREVERTGAGDQA
jgi:hypothetical protein